MCIHIYEYELVCGQVFNFMETEMLLNRYLYLELWETGNHFHSD